MVRRAYQRVRDQVGVELMALAEVEFFLGKPAEEVDLENMADNGYHATSPFVFGEALRREACVILAQMGVPVKYAHSEVGHIAADDASPFVYEQHEIELSLAPLPAAAEATALTAWVLRNLARKRGYRISLSPVVREGHAGSGLHFFAVLLYVIPR